VTIKQNTKFISFYEQKTNLFYLKVNTKRERRSSNNKTPNNNDSPTQSFATLGALVTGLTSTPTTMSDETNQADTLIEINGNHSPLKNFPVKNGNEIVDEQRNISTPSHIDYGVDSGLSSEITNTETEKINGDDEVSSTSGISSTLHALNNSLHRRESSPISGVIIPEEKRVTDRVKVFEAVANKNGNTKKKSSTSSSFSTGDAKQISPSSTESFDSQSINEIKSTKTKSKKSSLKKQIQNLLKIDKPSVQDDYAAMDDQMNGKKNKKDNSKK
jgi:hypothetical protein